MINPTQPSYRRLAYALVEVRPETHHVRAYRYHPGDTYQIARWGPHLLEVVTLPWDQARIAAVELGRARARRGLEPVRVFDELRGREISVTRDHWEFRLSHNKGFTLRESS